MDDLNNEQNYLNNLVYESNSAKPYIKLINESNFDTRIEVIYVDSTSSNKILDSKKISRNETQVMYLSDYATNIHVSIQYFNNLNTWIEVKYLQYNTPTNGCFRVYSDNVNIICDEIECNSVLNTSLVGVVGADTLNSSSNYVSAVNTSSFTARLTVSYRVPGKTSKTYENIKISSKKSGKINFPSGSYDFDVKIEVSSLISSWKVIYNKGFNNLISKCFKVSGGVLSSATVEIVACNAIPELVGSIGDIVVENPNDNTVQSNTGYINVANTSFFTARLTVSYRVAGKSFKNHEKIKISSKSSGKINFPMGSYGFDIRIDVSSLTSSWKLVYNKAFNNFKNKCFKISGGVLTSVKVDDIPCSSMKETLSNMQYEMSIDGCVDDNTVENNDINTDINESYLESNNHYIKVKNSSNFNLRVKLSYKQEEWKMPVTRVVRVLSKKSRSIYFQKGAYGLSVSFEIDNNGKWMLIKSISLELGVKKCYEISGNSINNIIVNEIMCN
ncbi:MAG: hypothetical protein ACRC7R_02860 [Sarcina sp.]